MTGSLLPEPRFFGERLRLARLVQGLSLEEVGARVEATRQAVHQFETGARLPNPTMEGALADVLSVHVEFFRTPVARSIAPEHCHFRRRLTTPQGLVQQALARGTLAELLIRELERYLDLPEVDFPDLAIGGDPRDVERAAETCRSHWGLGLLGPITNMTRVVENAGAVVVQFDGLGERIDALSMDCPRPVIVRNTAKGGLCRQRFDLAHECAHLVLHKGVETGLQATEDQANRFASAFLLPRAAFLREFPRSRRRLDWQALGELKLRWKVSFAAIVRRAFDLQLIDAAQYRSANIQLAKTGQAKQERYDDILLAAQEPPELLEAALDALSPTHGAVLLADRLGVTPELLAGLFGLRRPEPEPSWRPSADIVPLPLRRG